MRRNAMATLLLSHGTPMILMGDEIGRTQDGNNNAYCQDNEIAWLKWGDIADRDRAFMEFTRGLIRLRARHPLLRSRQYLHGRKLDDENTRDVVWYKPDGGEMGEGDWNNPASKIVGMLLCDETKCRLLMIANSYHEPLDFQMPGGKNVGRWRVLADTFTNEIEPRNRVSEPGSTIRVEGRSLLLFGGEE
jgi:glycogen operon protein